MAAENTNNKNKRATTGNKNNNSASHSQRVPKKQTTAEVMPLLIYIMVG
jgi:hypothetical protein